MVRGLGQQEPQEDSASGSTSGLIPGPDRKLDALGKIQLRLISTPGLFQWKWQIAFMNIAPFPNGLSFSECLGSWPLSVRLYGLREHNRNRNTSTGTYSWDWDYCEERIVSTAYLFSFFIYISFPLRMKWQISALFFAPRRSINVRLAFQI